MPQGKSAASFDTITELSVVQPGYDLAARVAFSKVDPSPYWPQSAAILRNCPHPAAAELFSGYAVTDVTQYPSLKFSVAGLGHHCLTFARPPRCPTLRRRCQ